MELTKYLKGTLRWWWLILLSTVIAAGASYFASLQQPRIYNTTATLMVGQVIQQTEITGNDFLLTERLAQSYAQMTDRQPILQATVDSLGLDMHWQGLKGRVYAYPIPRTQLLAVQVQDVSPQRAVAIADEIAYQLILQSPTSPQNQKRTERAEFVQGQLDDLELRIETAQGRISELETELATALSARQIQDLQSEISSLEKLINEWQVNYSNLLDFLEGGDTPNHLTIIEPAQLPTNPVSPDVPTNVALAAAVGFSLALGAALLLEYLDNTIKSVNDFNGQPFNLASLGVINQITGSNYNDKLVSTVDAFSPTTEAYRQIRTNIQFMAIDQPAKSIIITSASTGEGKSTTASNLAVVMAQTELKTVIIDADLRKPSLHKIFQVPNLGGLTDLLTSNDVDVQDLLKDTGYDNLKIITSGLLPPNPSEMLGSQRMMNLLTQLNDMVDVIILDTSPVMAVTDAIVLSKRVDGVVIVTRSKSTRRDALNHTIERLNQVGANILGAVLNRATGKESRVYKYYSHSEEEMVGQPVEQTSNRRWWHRLLPASK